MDKRLDGLAGALREIAEKRDERLRDTAAIPADRFEQLQAVVAAELPVETALFAAARRRDDGLSAAELALPSMVRAALLEQVASQRAAAHPFLRVRELVSQFEARRWRAVYRAAAAVVAAALVTAVGLRLSRSTESTARSHGLPRDSVVNLAGVLPNDQLFEKSGDRLALRMTRLELASLDLSSFTINRGLAELTQPDRVLPLDLPIRQIRLDVESVRTP